MRKKIQSIIDRVLVLPPHKNIKFDRNEIPHPRKIGFRRSIGAPKGQIADYRLKLNNGKSIHAQRFGRKWYIHWDKVDPIIGVFKHMQTDAKEYYVLTISLIGVTLVFLVWGGFKILIDSKRKE